MISIGQADFIIDLAILIVLFFNLMVIGKALDVIDCLHDHMHDVLDNLHIADTEEEVPDPFTDVLFEDMP